MVRQKKNTKYKNKANKQLGIYIDSFDSLVIDKSTNFFVCNQLFHLIFNLFYLYTSHYFHFSKYKYTFAYFQ